MVRTPSEEDGHRDHKVARRYGQILSTGAEFIAVGTICSFAPLYVDAMSARAAVASALSRRGKAPIGNDAWICAANRGLRGIVREHLGHLTLEPLNSCHCEVFLNHYERISNAGASQTVADISAPTTI